MKKFKVITISLILLAIIFFIIVITVNILRSKDYDFQMRKLESEKVEEKIRAAEFVGDNKIVESIPILINYVQSGEFFLYQGKSPWTLSCASTRALENITNAGIGDSCCDNFECRERERVIPQEWKAWYANEYQTWLQNKANVS